MNDEHRNAISRGHCYPFNRTQFIDLGEKLLLRKAVGSSSLVSTRIRAPVIDWVDAGYPSTQFRMGNCPSTRPEPAATPSEGTWFF